MTFSPEEKALLETGLHHEMREARITVESLRRHEHPAEELIAFFQTRQNDCLALIRRLREVGNQ